MSLRDLIACALVKCVPMTEAEYQALLKRQKHNIGKRQTLHLHRNNRSNRHKWPAAHVRDDGKRSRSEPAKHGTQRTCV